MKADAFWVEYTSQEAIAKYSRRTAGAGINYLLNHDYADKYRQALQLVSPELKRQGIRLLEFGCGAGMNLLHLSSTLAREGIRIESAVGSDFSPVLIAKAQQEAKECLGKDQLSKMRFVVAKNEALIEDLSLALGKSPTELNGTFHFIFGVNTFRYCHRAGKQLDCARAIHDLLIPGGVCVIIDMNNRFPAFRSALRDKFRKKSQETYLPSLEEYSEPFAKAGFEVLRSEHFCWVPHSASGRMTWVFRHLSPVLNALAKSRAMRSIILARKPAPHL